MGLLRKPVLLAGLVAVAVAFQACADQSPSLVTKEPGAVGVQAVSSGSSPSYAGEDEQSGESGAGGHETDKDSNGAMEEVPAQPALSGTELPEGVSPALARDAQWYADHHGVELSEAITRLMLQDEIGVLGAEIESREADTLAGFWIQHEPDYRVIVSFTKDGESTIAKYVQDGPLLELIEVRTAEATLRDLDGAQQEAGRIVADLGFNVASGIDVKRNRVEIYATDRKALQTALQDSGKTLPEHVVIVGP